jgi:hypothetical protein
LNLSSASAPSLGHDSVGVPGEVHEIQLAQAVKEDFEDFAQPLNSGDSELLTSIG